MLEFTLTTFLLRALSEALRGRFQELLLKQGLRPKTEVWTSDCSVLKRNSLRETNNFECQ